MGTPHETSYGLAFTTITPNEWEWLKPKTFECGWTDYDRNQITLHIMNCGYGILDTHTQTPIDNEYDLEEIYGMLR